MLPAISRKENLLLNRFTSYPLPDWLQQTMERNVGRAPLWKFPNIIPMFDGVYFEKLDFENRYQMAEMFHIDADSWIDERFKDPQQLYEYVGQIRISMPYSGKHGGCDWLVLTPEKEPAGVLHMYHFSRETYGYQNKKCFVGYAFAETHRGSGLPYRVMEHFHTYLFQKLNRLLLVANPERGNARSIRFLEKLGYEDRTLPDYTHKDDEGKVKKEPKVQFFELYRSRQVRAWIHRYRKD